MNTQINLTVAQTWNCSTEAGGFMFWWSNESNVTFYATPFYEGTRGIALQINEPTTQDTLFSFDIPCNGLIESEWQNISKPPTAEQCHLYRDTIKSLLPLIIHTVTQYQKQTTKT